MESYFSLPRLDQVIAHLINGLFLENSFIKIHYENVRAGESNDLYDQ